MIYLAVLTMILSKLVSYGGEKLTSGGEKLTSCDDWSLSDGFTSS